jgi:hypothetical protein
MTVSAWVRADIDRRLRTIISGCPYVEVGDVFLAPDGRKSYAVTGSSVGC